MVQRIESYYGKELGTEEARWVEQNLDGLSADECDKFIDVLGKKYRKGKGCPDIAIMVKALQTVRNAQKTYFWSVCAECGCEYDYRLMICPKCYEDGFKCTDKEIKVSSCRPPMKVIRYNKTFLNYKNAQGQKEMSCYRCEARELSFCPNFGNPDWNCMEYRNCKCNVCCSMERRANSRMKESKGKKALCNPIGEGLMSEPMTGYTKCPKCGLVVYVHKDEGTCFVCGKIKIERGKKKEDKKKKNGSTALPLARVLE